MNITATIDDRRLKVVKEANKRARAVIYSELKKQSKELYNEVRGTVKASIAYQASPGFKHSTGALLKSLRELPIDEARHQWRIGVSIGKGVKYAKVIVGPPTQLTVIQPKVRDYLAIPLTDEAWHLSNRGGGKVSLYDKRFVGGGKLIRKGSVLGKKISPSFSKAPGSFVPMFALKKSVMVRAKVDVKEVVRRFAPKFKERLKRRLLEDVK